MKCLLTTYYYINYFIFYKKTTQKYGILWKYGFVCQELNKAQQLTGKMISSLNQTDLNIGATKVVELKSCIQNLFTQ